MGKAAEFPYVGTTYRLTEHFHYWTKHSRLNAITQPQQFIEIGERLANEKGISHGDTVRVSSKRGYIKAKAVVTKRIRTLDVNGQKVDTIGIPIHWGFEGVAVKGFITNTLTPFVGDANTQTPEFKAFPVNVERCKEINYVNAITGHYSSLCHQFLTPHLRCGILRKKWRSLST